MKRKIFDALQSARAAKRAVVVATALKDGRQVLIDGDKAEGDLPASETIRAAARRALRDDKSHAIETDAGPVFVQAFNTPLRMLIVGAVHIAQALAPIAVTAGYAVTIIDPRRSFATAARFPGVTLTHDWPDEAMDRVKLDARTAVVTLTHDPKIDDPALERALRSDCFYIGCLGSTRTHKARLARLVEQGFGEKDFARLHGPIGLDIGAQSPAEIAISIIAEVTAALRREPEAAAAAAATAAA
ncbi:MAG TPA: XdhC family protein [Alphaproteobacteria bacterium]|jgi:xanthine dehydrogenase accessory factor